jgi:16S rRNA (guanine527-N7)-methyltransferase
MTLPVHELDVSEIIALGSHDLGVTLEVDTISMMVRHLDMLEGWRDRLNLTSLTDRSKMAVRLFLDSITVLKIMPEQHELRLLDVGTGGGFPGMVLQAASRNLKVTLMDRDPRKIVFLKHAAEKLGLSSLSFLNRSLNDLLQSPPNPLFDVVVSRAFSSIPRIMDSLADLTIHDGHLIVMAGPSSHNRFELSNFHEIDSWQGTLPFSDRYRRVILYKKKT